LAIFDFTNQKVTIGQNARTSFFVFLLRVFFSFGAAIFIGVVKRKRNLNFFGGTLQLASRWFQFELVDRLMQMLKI